MHAHIRSRYRLLRIILPLFLFVFGCVSANPPPRMGPGADEANVALLGDLEYLAPGSQAAFLVQVRSPYNAQRQLDAAVAVYLNNVDGDSRQVYSGVTGADGMADVRFAVPTDLAEPQQVLEIRTQLPADGAGEFSTYRDVYIGRTYNVLLSTDKPVYQPGQVIHLRGLALDALDLHPAVGMSMTLTLADPQGNKLLRQDIPTSAYGIASVDFPLDSQAASGNYSLTAQIGPTTSTRSVEVKPYTLPRFAVEFQPASTFYLPGQTAAGTIEAHYFFGKPVAGGLVQLHGTLDDGSGAVAVANLSGVTDADGRYAYQFDVPAALAGKLDNRSIDIDLAITVSDATGHSEAVDESITVAEKTLLIKAVPEAGRLRRNLDDRVYLEVTYPDGVAAQAALTVTDQYSATFTAVSDAYGQAVITLTTPNNGLTPLLVTADDGAGHVVEQPLALGSEQSDSEVALLLRPDRAAYQIGDTLQVDILVAGAADTVYLDIIKDRQSFGLAALPVTGGVAQAAMAVDGKLLGTLELNVYAVDGYGRIARDRRYVLVDPAPAEVAMRADKPQHRPGETATLDIQVSQAGQPLPAAVGISIVDESVLAVEDQDPGFARTYFLLNRELQQARYKLHDFVDLPSGQPSPYDSAPDSVQYARTAAAQPLAAKLQSEQLALAAAFGEILADEADVAAGRQPAPAAPVEPWALAAAWGNRLYLAAPLLGLALYDGSRRRRQLLIALVVFGLGAFVWGACAAPAAAPAQPVSIEQPAETTTATHGQKPPRLRQFFPETLYWLPEVVTDAQGRAQIEVPIADSITTWRASLLVSDQQGHLGSSELDMRVFQDFFVEPDLPRSLTVGDEVDVPFAIYNYLPEAQTIELAVTPGDWFELRGEPQLVIALQANSVQTAYLPLRVTRFGRHSLQIGAQGTHMSDAVLREVEVLPNGQRVTDVAGGQLAASQVITLPSPANAIPGAGSVTVRIYPGIVSQVLAGLDGLLQMPYGCFEQTSSATYPNVLVLDYLQRTDQAGLRIQLQAKDLISLGYQQLLRFEVPGEPGGFSLFGDAPADTMLTAYGLLEFHDMGEVAYVDPDLIERMADFLIGQQAPDGSWAPSGRLVDEPALLEGKVAATAYIAWGLADADYADDPAVRQALRYLQRGIKSAGGSGQIDDGLSNYTLALTANALAAGGEDAAAVLDLLLARAATDGDQIYWTPGVETYLGSSGTAATIETTALVAQALLRSEQAPDVAARALAYVAAHRDAAGSFYTTQATVQALKALLLGEERRQRAAADRPTTVTVDYIHADGTVETQTSTVDAGSADLVQQITFAAAEAGGRLALTAEGDRTLQYQVISDFYLPWEVATAHATIQEPLHLSVSYDRSELAVNDLLGVRAEVELLTRDTAGALIVELGIPPGFAPLTADLDELMREGLIDRYELRGQQIILYLTNVQSGQTYTFPYRLQALYPLDVQTPGSQLYNYYTPEQRVTEPPQRIIVTLGVPND